VHTTTLHDRGITIELVGLPAHTIEDLKTAQRRQYS
jgi:hypothetical protein